MHKLVALGKSTYSLKGIYIFFLDYLFEREKVCVQVSMNRRGRGRLDRHMEKRTANTTVETETGVMQPPEGGRAYGGSTALLTS